MPWNASDLPEFTWSPSELSRQLVLDVVVVKFNSGKEQRWKRGFPRWLYTLTFNNIERAVANAISNFYLDREGPLKPFKFYDPIAEETKYVRFDSGCEFIANMLQYVRSVTLSFIEVHPSEIVV